MVIQRRNTIEADVIQRALFQVGTFDEKTRTVQVVMATDTPAKMYNWELGYYMEILQIERSAIKAARLDGGLPVLDNHNRWSSMAENGCQVGIVENWDIQGGKLVGTVRFSNRPDLEGFVTDVKDGIIRNVSIGYRVNAYQIDTPATDGKMGVYRAIDWEPMEVSFVPVPADPGATTRSAGAEKKTPNTFKIVDADNNEISTKNLTNTNNSKTKVMTEEEKQALLEQERQRCLEINRLCREAGLDDAQARTYINDNKTIDQVKAAIDQIKGIATSGTKAAVDEALKQVRDRAANIRAAIKEAKIEDAAFELEMITSERSVEEVQKEIIKRYVDGDVNAGATNTNSGKVTADGEDKLRTRMEDTLILRSGAMGHKFTDEQKNGAREFMGRSVITMVRSYFDFKGIDHKLMTDQEVAKRALSNSDFPNILANTINRSLRQAYQLAPRTFLDFCRRVSAKDFRPMYRTQLSGMYRGFEEIKPGGEYKASKMDDSKEQYAITKYGEKVVITWESLINDDLNAFARLPQAIAENAAQKQSDLVYAILIGNPALADGFNLFDLTNHGNYITGPGTVLSADNLGVGRQKLREQKSPAGHFLNLMSDFLIVGPSNETRALRMTSSEYLPNTQDEVNPWKSLRVIVEPRITGLAWFLASNPGRIDTLEYAFLEGEQEIYTESKWGFGSDVYELKARMEFGAAAIDHRGLFKNDGAAS